MRCGSDREKLHDDRQNPRFCERNEPLTPGVAKKRHGWRPVFDWMVVAASAAHRLFRNGLCS
jgi:hypothetical protein